MWSAEVLVFFVSRFHARCLFLVGSNHQNELKQMQMRSETKKRSVAASAKSKSVSYQNPSNRILRRNQIHPSSFKKEARTLQVLAFTLKKKKAGTLLCLPPAAVPWNVALSSVPPFANMIGWS